jgi:hypothetical protein
MSCWKYKKECLEEPPSGYFGFIYMIYGKYTDKLPKELQGKIYVGKKQFTYSVKKKLSKKARKTTRKRVTKVQKDSGWLSYWGSNKELISDVKKYGEDCFERVILELCKNKSQLSYGEVYHQIDKNVMYENSYNGWISCKVFKKFLNE